MQPGTIRHATQEQRRSVIPHLLDYADDASLDAQTHGWVYQALRDISGQNLPNDSNAWRSWYSTSGSYAQKSEN